MEKIKNIFSFEVADTTVGGICSAIIILCIGLFICRIIKKIINRAFAAPKFDKTLAGFIRSFASVVIYFVLIIIVAGKLGIPTSSLVALLSVAGLAVSLAAENVLSNLTGGITLLALKPFEVGNFVEIGDKTGYITELGLFYTKIVTLDNKDIFIPNKDVSAAHIVNFSSRDKRRVDQTYTVSYDCDIDDVIKSFKTVFDNEPLILKNEECFARVSDYQSSAIEYTVRVWTKTDNYWEVYFNLRENVKKQFDKDGIIMTYDHLNVHIMQEDNNDQTGNA